MTENQESGDESWPTADQNVWPLTDHAGDRVELLATLNRGVSREAGSHTDLHRVMGDKVLARTEGLRCEGTLQLGAQEQN
jgi:hypothetical protein